MNSVLAIDVVFLLLATYFFYQISYSFVDITLKSPLNQRQQSFVFPQNFTTLQDPLYSKLIFVILDGITYDYVDNRIKEIPYVKDDCDIHIHQINVFNELIIESPQSAILSRLEIEQPPKTEIKISTYLKGTNPVVFSLKIPEANPNKINMQDSLIYQIGQSDKLKKNYGYLTSYFYDYIGYYLSDNQFANLGLKYSEDSKIQEYMEIIKSNSYDTLFIYEGAFDEISHSEGMHTQNGLEAQKKIDTLIRNVVKNMDEDAIMVLVSDHGKSDRGAHFNCRDENIKICNSVFFAYTKKGFIKDDQFIQSLRRKETDERISKQAEQFSVHESMISSTISNLLNIPVSFINSGRSLLEIYPKDATLQPHLRNQKNI
ncbi:type I phosphodiesterase/nucleotide pyrophosphatase (macronuclear) [Tetrahymena thermophila SB210]|uniref:Type I phosphodiesterase/nucleotide pyrophosphatase n=1 Tax=Tetrahymena thermophila (strain SB210) TaxID=312017 RepID=I7LVT9_TETTS|nr:type I phosphodiesterase/nucleotide pyrophosphatase [Tetrahymena thermophila SB210]EAR99708.1 type I phosphodiesterase/nucleotide pyrophosphatase [Tetrahymena thermophila SB210]|eukprot:XP_001019953.1 type I phosphodiesterase/nucleotide pyrophosphatase [Tetrahymena thermophila SB210]